MENSNKYNVIVCGCNTDTEELGIGIDINGVSTMSWCFSSDMEHFKNTTNGNFVLMGMKTWISIPEKFRPLGNRINIIITSKADELNKEKIDKYNKILTKNNNNFMIGIDSDANNLYSYNYVHFAKTPEDGYKFYNDLSNVRQDFRELFVIGGDMIYKYFIDNFPNKLNKLFLTHVFNKYPCNKYFSKKYFEQKSKLIFDLPAKSDINKLSILNETIHYNIKVYQFN